MVSVNPWMRAFPPEPEQNTIFRANPGPRNMPAANSTPVKYFYLLFSIELIKEIVRRTNSYARNFIRKGAATAKRYARMKSWRPLTENELKSFLAIVFNMGLIRKSSIEEYWNSSLPSQASHWFKKVMSRNRFQNILKFLYVSDYSRNVPRQHPAYDPASRFRPLLSFMNKQFCRFIVPKKEVCVDETLMATKGHNVMRQYIPSKAAKFGIKFWMLCESATGYILQMSVYRGRHFDPVPAGQLQGTTVVMNLMSASNILNKGYHVFCDSFFCSQNLASRLIQTTTYITGTLRKNRPMPNTIRNANPTPDNPVYMRKGKMLCAAFRDMDGKKPVRMLSTAFSAQHLPSGRPRIVNGYNKNMGAVDTTDAIMKAYGGHRKNRKPWKKVVLHLFHRIVHNAYILYQKTRRTHQ
ncbi:unnamed protein product [Mytilus edulis]|uniref:PiggyBac transposable element-derived protein domain-containing protein n=1 Tax=Mytilus edulis TaxID=6550 RepID=A0A8S3RRY0_MYTED|nr:unnamed protein product [Mytilus edulis]